MRFIKAVKIFDGNHFLPAGSVLVIKDGKILEVAAPGSVPADRTEHLDGIVTPGFVNAHCHLELSHLRGRLRKQTGFCEFAVSLTGIRSRNDLRERHAAMQEAVSEMKMNGIAAVGDISNTAESFGIKKRSGLYFHTFIELIGLHPDAAEKAMAHGLELAGELEAEGLAGSLAPHAPYSVSADLMRRIAAYDKARGLPVTMHSQESVEEARFFMGEACGLHELYRKLGIDLSFFEPTGKPGVENFLPALEGTHPLLVHNTFASAADVDLAAHAGAAWCFCPNANLFIEGRQPDYRVFGKHPRRLCIGTDSLASNDRLDVLDELNKVAASAPFFGDEELLAMVTGNGASALGISDRYGHLSPGTAPGINLLRQTGRKFERIDIIAPCSI